MQINKQKEVHLEKPDRRLVIIALCFSPGDVIIAEIFNYFVSEALKR